MVPAFARVVLGNDGECGKAVPVVFEYPEQRRLLRGDTYAPGAVGIDALFGQLSHSRGLLTIYYKYFVPGVRSYICRLFSKVSWPLR